MLLLAAVVVAALAVRPTGGRLSALAQVRLRFVPAILGSLCLQVVIISVLPDGSPGLHRLLHVVSYVLAATFLVANRRVRGMWIVALGAALNLVAILANDGVMPASRSALRAAGVATKSQGFANRPRSPTHGCSNSATSSPSRNRGRSTTCSVSATSASRSA